MLGLADRGKIYDLLEQILEGKAEEALIIYKDLYNSGSDIVLIFFSAFLIIIFSKLFK